MSKFERMIYSFILAYFETNPDGTITVRDVARFADEDPFETRGALESLEEKGYINVSVYNHTKLIEIYR